MRLRASVPSYKQIEVDVNPKKTVKDFKEIVCKKLGIEPELTKLMLNGKQLAEASRVTSLRSISGPLIVDYLWARHLLAWGAEGQRKLRAAKVLLAGAGAIGNEAAKNLAMLGVGTIVIADRDLVEMSNISRMIFFKPKDLGKNKAEVLASNINQKYPFVATVAYRGKLETMPLKLYLDSDVIVCGLDNVISRIFLSQMCRKYSIPLVDAGIIGLNGRVHTYIPPNDACPICMFPPNEYSSIVGLRNPCDASPDQETVPSFATSISLVSSILAQETIKVILGLKEYEATGKWPEKTGQPLRTVLFLDLKNNRYTPLDIKRSKSCIVCGKEGTARDPVPRGDLPIAMLRHSQHAVERAVREASRTSDGKLTILLETSRGEEKVDGGTNRGKLAERGDYLRVFVENKNQELHESILKLS